MGHNTPTAGLGPRLLARLLDAVLVYLPAGLVLQILGLPPPVFPLGGVDVWAWGAATGLVWFGYYAAFEATSGATIGKRLLKLRIAQLVAVVVLAVSISSNEYHRGKHDESAATAVMA